MTTPPLRKRLYALQQRAALTGPEAGALLVTAVILLAGFAVRHVEAGREPAPSPAFALLDAELAAAAARPASEALSAREGPAHEEPADAVPTEGRGGGGGGAPSATGEGGGAGGERGGGAPSRLGPVRVNVNAAPPRTLERLPGIGPALAARIVEHREAHGPFRRAEDLTAVRGIGPKTVEKLAPYVALE